jgi:hypothetical protein
MEIIPLFFALFNKAVIIPVSIEMKYRPMALLRHTQFPDMFAQQMDLYIKSVILTRMLIAKMIFMMGILLTSG